MKAVICSKHGGSEVLEVQKIDKPQPKENKIMIKIKASSITSDETLMRKYLYARVEVIKAVKSS